VQLQGWAFHKQGLDSPGSPFSMLQGMNPFVLGTFIPLQRLLFTPMIYMIMPTSILRT
jgi:hypothetical protein